MNNDYTVTRFPRIRRGMVDYFHLAWSKHNFRVLFDLDVTDLRRAIRRYRRETGKELSLTAYLISVYSHLIGEYPEMQAYRKGFGKLVVYQDVDVNTIVEREVDGEMHATTYILRRANSKSFEEIQSELTAAKSATSQSAFAGDTIKNRGSTYAKLPRFARRLLLRYSRWNPHFRRRLFGTVGFSAVSMYARQNGYPVVITPHTLGVVLGGIGRKPAVVGDEVKPREMLSVAVSFDHDVLDGAPATRFLSTFTRTCLRCHGLESYAPADLSAT